MTVSRWTLLPTVENLDPTRCFWNDQVRKIVYKTVFATLTPTGFNMLRIGCWLVVYRDTTNSAILKMREKKGEGETMSYELADRPIILKEYNIPQMLSPRHGDDQLGTFPVVAPVSSHRLRLERT